MIELYENIIQITVLIICVIVALSRSLAARSRTLAMLSFVYGSWVLGDLYWLACLLFFDKTPEISVVSDLSWYASYIFLFLLLRYIIPPEELSGTKAVAWLGPLFTAGMAFFFMTFGDILNNLIYAALMGFLFYASLRRLADTGVSRPKLILPLLILIFCLLEYGLWTASCFGSNDAVNYPYYIFDLLLTVSFPFFLPAVKKAVTA